MLAKGSSPCLGLGEVDMLSDPISSALTASDGFD